MQIESFSFQICNCVNWTFHQSFAENVMDLINVTLICQMMQCVCVCLDW